MRHQNSARLSWFRTTLRSRIRPFIGALLVAAFAVSAASIAEPLATLRGETINQEPRAPMMGKQVNTDLRAIRNYPEQPPTIPHKTRGYAINLQANKCLSCHSRRAIEQSQAPMISVTHFMDREGQVLSSVTPRRYFCNQCHVPQLDAKPLVGNDFVDADAVIKAKGN